MHEGVFRCPPPAVCAGLALSILLLAFDLNVSGASPPARSHNSLLYLNARRCGFPSGHLRSTIIGVKRFFLPLIIALGGCQLSHVEGIQSPVSSDLKRETAEWRGQKFASNRCADCHSIGYGETSPLPNAPSFAAIASTPELSKSTLTFWMKNHRNYPEEMYFEIPEEHIEDVVAYMLTLRR